MTGAKGIAMREPIHALSVETDQRLRWQSAEAVW